MKLVRTNNALIKLSMAIAVAMFFIATSAFAVPDPDAETGLELLRKGNVAEAKARFESAVARDPSNYDAVLFYMSALPAKDALRAADSLSRSDSPPGWARAKSLRFLGDHQFARGDYKKAADFYQQASKFDNSSVYKHLYALSIAADGRTDAAREIWATVAGDNADDMSAEAAAMLAQIGSGNQQIQTVSVDKPIIPVSQQTAVFTNDKPAVPVSQPAVASIDKPAPPISQQSAVSSDKPATPVSQQVAVVTDKPAAPASDKFFTIQVGSFGSKENADNLVKKLAGTYSDITISAATSGDQKTLYRVRIGTFRNRDDAVVFADKIKESGMTAMVVEK